MKKSIKEWESDSEDPIVGFDSYLDNGVFKLVHNTVIGNVTIPAGTPIDQVNKIWAAKKATTQLKEIILKTIKEVLREDGLTK